MAAKHRDENICVPTADSCTVQAADDEQMLKEEVYHHMHEPECLLTCEKCAHDTDGQPGHTQGLGEGVLGAQI